MGTRSYIGVVNPDKTITAIYCHWDGYPSHNGMILKESYGDPAKVAELMLLGNLSILGDEIGVKHKDHEDPDHKMCLSYTRDKGEEDQAAASHLSEAEFRNVGYDCNAEYLYLFKNNKWKVMALAFDRWGWKAVTPMLKALKALDR